MRYDSTNLIVHPRQFPEPGLVTRVTPEQAGWKFITFEVRRLAAGQSHTTDSGNCELALVMLSGALVTSRRAGMIDIQAIKRAFPPGSTVPIGGVSGNDELTGEYLIRATGKTAVGGGAYLSTFGAIWSGGAMIRLYQDAANDVDFNAAGGNTAAIATATNGVLWAELGDTAPGVTFWTVTFATDVITSLIDAPAEGVALLPIGTGDFALNLIPQGALAEVLPILPGSYGTDFSGTVTYYGMDALPGTPGLQRALDNFDIVSDADISFILVPEPASASLLAAAGMLLARRRRA